jgi:biopolymer transport protein ExbD
MAALVRRARVYALPQAEPNVIPFIDVLLVLLIIFMVTAPKPTTDLRLDLPSRGGEPSVIEPTIVEIQAAPDGYRVFISGAETTLDRLPADALAHMFAANPAITREDAFADGRIFVRSDLCVAYQHVITVVETLQQARFQQVAIYAQSADAGDL